MQINRLFEMVYILLNKEKVTAKEFSERFEVSKRTIYRDIEILSSAGIPIYMNRGKNGGISLLPEFILNKAVITDKEKEDILSALKTMNAISFTETDAALKKLSGFFGEANTSWIEVDFSSWGNSQEETEKFNLIKQGIFQKRILCFEYSSGKAERLTRIVEPLKLIFKSNAWYLYGYCRNRDDYRFFKLARVKQLKIQGENFERQVPEETYDFREAPDLEFVDLHLKIAPQMAYRVYDEFEEYEQLEDGSFIVSITYPQDKWLFYYIFSFGSFCEVLKPESLRKTVKEELEKTLNHYL